MPNLNATKITEAELDNLMAHHIVKFAVEHKKPLPIGIPVADGSASRALAAWIAVLTKVYLKEIGGHSKPIVEKIWTFENGTSDVDMRVGVRGAYKKLKVTTEMTGPSCIRMRIVSWDTLGHPGKTWERFAVYYGNESGAGFHTLPLR